MLKNNPNLSEPHVSRVGGSLLVLLGFVLIGMAVGNLLAVMCITFITGSGFDNTANLINQLILDPQSVPNGWYIMMLFQGVVHFFSYLLPSLLYLHFIEKLHIGELNFRRIPTLNVWILALVVVVVFIPFNSQIIEWNTLMKFPEALSGLEKWMKGKEDQIEEMTKFLTSYQSVGQLLIALFVVVLLPAVGEEALFRGLLQRKLSRVMNIHVAIWLAAAIFSAIHFQFYGFFPRMLLGALFGYLYYITGNFWVAVLAHFVNNGFVLILMFLYNIKVIDINIEETKTMPLITVLCSIFLSGIIIFKIYQSSVERERLAT